MFVFSLQGTVAVGRYAIARLGTCNIVFALKRYIALKAALKLQVCCRIS